MPRCERCTKSVPSYELKYVRGTDDKTILACATCRAPAELVSGGHEADHQIAALSLHQYETAEGKKDYRLRAELAHGGLHADYQFTFNEAREFFKGIKDKKKPELKAV